MRLTKIAYGWPPDAHFLVPDEAKKYMSKAVERGAKWEQEWNAKYKPLGEAIPELAKMWQQMSNANCPHGWDKDIPTFPADAQGSGHARRRVTKVQNAVAAKVPWLLGGSADLYPSTKTLIKDGGDFEKGNYGGTQLPLRHSRARHGLDRQRHGAVVSAALRRDVLYLLRLHAAHAFAWPR